jgi:hypothetical protein
MGGMAGLVRLNTLYAIVALHITGHEVVVVVVLADWHTPTILL